MALIYGSPGEEPGDKHVFETLRSLPDDWIVYAQPKFVARQQERNPDYALVHRDRGIIVLEVKDWTRIAARDRKTATVIRARDGSESSETSPVEQARQACFVLLEMLKGDKDLTSYGGKLDFPYRYAGVLPHLPPSTVRWLADAWGEGKILGRDDVMPGLIGDRLNEIPAPFYQPMSENQVRAVCAVIDARNRILDPRTGEFKGVYDRTQEQIAKESLAPVEASVPSPVAQQELGLAEEPDPSNRLKHLEQGLPDEAKDLKATAHIRLVRGFAGTGKTDVLILRAAYLAEQHPNLRILVATFNDPLFRERLQPELQTCAPAVMVMKFDSICSAVYQAKYGEWTAPQDTLGLLRWMAEHDPDVQEAGADFLGEEILWMKETGRTVREAYVDQIRSGRGGLGGKVLTRAEKDKIFDLYLAYQQELAGKGVFDWVDLHDKAYQFLCEGHVPWEPFDVILVDEAQHFAPRWMQIVFRLLKPGGSVFLCDDPSQSVYRTYTWRQKGVDVAGRTRWLRVPYRNTREVFAAAYALLQASAEAMRLASESGEAVSPDTADVVMRSGPLPQVHSFPTARAEERFVLEEIARLLSEEGFVASEIGLLHQEKYILERYQRILPKGVRVFEIRKQTGLEYKAVFLPQVGKLLERTVGLAWEEDRVRQTVKLYSAMTRARERLYLLTSERVPGILEPAMPFVDAIGHGPKSEGEVLPGAGDGASKEGSVLSQAGSKDGNGDRSIP